MFSELKLLRPLCLVDFDKLVPIRPGVLVHEPQRMEELVHGCHQTVGETSRVQIGVFDILISHIDYG